MRIAAPLGLFAWLLVLVNAARRFNSRALSNIELLVPLMASDDAASVESDTSSAGERYDRARLDKDMPYSNIPASEFVLDENIGFKGKKKPGHKHSRKQDFENWPRSVYVESRESGESDEAGELGALVWRACRRLARSAAARQHELLLVLCSELLDSAPSPPSPPPACACCQQAPLPPGLLARRDLMPLGDDPHLVQKYMRSRERKRRYHNPDWASI